MEKNEIVAILNDWNFWQKDLPSGIRRNFYLQKFKQYLPTRQILVVTGARRSGKSFLMRQLAKELMATGVAKNAILMINFEDPRFTSLDAQALQKIYEIYLEALNPKETPYVFLDEVQEVTAWEKWVRMMQELEKAKIILSGSNSKLLSRELSTLLTGRHLDMTVFPLSFREFLRFNGISLGDELDVVNKRIEIKRLLSLYFQYGSFPEVVLREEKEKLLLTYFEDILNKDLIRRYKIRKGEKLKSLTKFYFTNIASPITFNSLEKFLEISSDTVEKFSEYLSSSYLMFFLKRFSFKVKEQEKSSRKVYTIDTGLANVIGLRFSENIGKLVENLVFLSLAKRKALDPNLELYYWRDIRGREVDFLIKEGTRVRQLIQVCWDLGNPKTKEREIRSLFQAMEELSISESLIITSEEEKEEKVGGKKIKFVPLWRWLLNG